MLSYSFVFFSKKSLKEKRKINLQLLNSHNNVIMNYEGIPVVDSNNMFTSNSFCMLVLGYPSTSKQINPRKLLQCKGGNIS